MVEVKTNWQSSEPLPDEEQLKALWQSEVASREWSLKQEEAAEARREADLPQLLRAVALSEAEFEDRRQEGIERAAGLRQESEAQLAAPPIDIDALHKHEIEVAEASVSAPESLPPPGFYGHVWHPFSHGWSGHWCGSASHDVQFDLNGKRIEAYANVDGLFWSLSELSMNAYLAYQMVPPSSGQLYIRVPLWWHGWYYAYSDAAGYFWSAYARVRLRTWVQAYQGTWRGRQVRTRLWIRGAELHPAQNGRMDTSGQHGYVVNVVGQARVIIRVGIHLDVYARDTPATAMLNLWGHPANYFYVPYVFWVLGS
jgi:hypothetical protein